MNLIDTFDNKKTWHYTKKWVDLYQASLRDGQWTKVLLNQKSCKTEQKGCEDKTKHLFAKYCKRV